MSRTGCCYNNAVTERFFWPLKQEGINHGKSEDIKEARRSVFRYIETFYNTESIHEASGYQATNESEAHPELARGGYNQNFTVHQAWAGALACDACYWGAA